MRKEYDFIHLGCQILRAMGKYSEYKRYNSLRQFHLTHHANTSEIKLEIILFF